MSEFRVPVERVYPEKHPDADVLDIANVQGFQVVVKRGDFKPGQLVAYIPEDAIVPDALIAEMGLTGRLAGSKKNRVKAIRLRGVVSQGLVYPARPGWTEGQDVAAELGITKYEPPLPAHMGGTNITPGTTTLSPHTWLAGSNRCLRYDFDNYKAHARREPAIFPDGSPVVFTEKLHGTWAQFAVMPPQHAHPEHGSFIVSSKGLAHKGIALDLTHPDAQVTFYARVAKQLDMERRIREAFPEEIETHQVFVLGEIIGQGVQDLAYTPTLSLRVFDVFIGKPIMNFLAPAEHAEIEDVVRKYYATNPEIPASYFGVSTEPAQPATLSTGRFLDDAELDAACIRLDLPRVPVLYRGPFSVALMQQYTDGLETVSGQAKHIREGIVVRPAAERVYPRVGRAILKSVSDDYRFRKGKTTEYQ